MPHGDLHKKKAKKNWTVLAIIVVFIIIIFSISIIKMSV